MPHEGPFIFSFSLEFEISMARITSKIASLLFVNSFAQVNAILKLTQRTTMQKSTYGNEEKDRCL